MCVLTLLLKEGLNQMMLRCLFYVFSVVLASCIQAYDRNCCALMHFGRQEHFHEKFTRLMRGAEKGP